jgi:hypothetical protein
LDGKNINTQRGSDSVDKIILISANSLHRAVADDSAHAIMQERCLHRDFIVSHDAAYLEIVSV